MSFSATSAAIKAFESELGYKLPKPTNEARDIGKKCLYGSRSENYYCGDTKAAGLKGEIFLFDFKAQYARIMAERPFPDFGQVVWSTKPVEERHVSFVDVEVQAINSIPALPFHVPPGKRDAALIPLVGRGSLIFPTGRFRGWYCDVDLANPGVRVTKYHKTANFPLPPFSFRGFIERFVPDRDSEVAKAIKKNIYTSFSGKFAQSNKRTMMVRNNPSTLKLDDYRTGVFFGDWVLVERWIPYPRFSNYIWTSYVQAYGRQEQFSLFSHIYTVGGRPLHGNTDSCLALMPSLQSARQVVDAFPRLTVSQKSEARVLSPKAYMYRDMAGTWEVTAAGIPRKLHGEITEAGDEVFAEIPDTFFEAMRRGAVDRELKNHWKTKRFTYSQKKTLGRIMRSDGWTRPIRLPIKGLK